MHILRRWAAIPPHPAPWEGGRCRRGTPHLPLGHSGLIVAGGASGFGNLVYFVAPTVGHGTDNAIHAHHDPTDPKGKVAAVKIIAFLAWVPAVRVT